MTGVRPSDMHTPPHTIDLVQGTAQSSQPLQSAGDWSSRKGEVAFNGESLCTARPKARAQTHGEQGH